MNEQLIRDLLAREAAGTVETPRDVSTWDTKGLNWGRKAMPSAAEMRMQNESLGSSYNQKPMAPSLGQSNLTSSADTTMSTPTAGGISDKKREKLKQIISLGQAIGGTESIDKQIMGMIMDTLMEEETDEIDELATMYELTGDPKYQELIGEKYDESKGINPSQNALLEKFYQDFNTEVSGPDLLRNIKIREQAKTDPGLIQRYYENPVGLFGNKEESLRRAGFNWR